MSYRPMMKVRRLFLVRSLVLLLVVVGSGTALAKTGGSGDPGWPREHIQNGNRLLVYQPQVDDWKNFHDLTWRMAVSLTPKGGKEVVGVVEMKGTTQVDNDNKLVLISNPEVTGTYFPSLDATQTQKIEQMFKSFVPPSVSISLFRLVASTPKSEPAAGVQLNNDPPKIFVAYRPSILLSTDEIGRASCRERV